MPEFIHVTLKNDTSSQHVYHATDDVLGQELFSSLVLGAGEESDPIELVADEDHHGRMTYGFRGGVDTRRDDLTEGEVVRG